jgi:hypothetical protein
MGIYQDNKDAMEFFRNSKQLESNGKWQEFVEQSELEAAVHEPRNMAQEPRNMYAGGQLVQNTADGSRPGYQGEEFSLEKNLSKVPPKIRERFIKVNNYLKKIIPELNAGEKYYTKEQVSSMVEKKFNIKPKYKTITHSGGQGYPSDKKIYKKMKVNQFEPKSYPVMRTLDSVETKIENTLKNMLIEKKPLNDFWYKALQERTGLNERTIYSRIDDSPTYKVIKDQGALSLKDRFNKPNTHKFLKNLSFSGQLTQALEMEKGMPRFTGMGKLAGGNYALSPKFKAMEFAKRNWHANKGEGLIKFFDKNGKRIDWNYGVELPYKEVSFSYNGKRHNIEKLNDIQYLKKNFSKVYETQIAINNLRTTEIDDPLKKGKKITLEDLVKRNQVNTYKWGAGTSTFDILHGKKGVKGEPFTNLSFNTRDVNQLEMGINQSTTLSQTHKNNLIKSINKLAGSGDPEAIIKRQVALTGDIKSGKITDYPSMRANTFKAHLQNSRNKTAAEAQAKLFKKLGIEISDICSNLAAGGGRIGFATKKCGMALVQSNPDEFIKIAGDEKYRKIIQAMDPNKFKSAARGIVKNIRKLGVANPFSWIGGEVWYVGLDTWASSAKGIPLNEALDKAFIFKDFGTTHSNLIETAKEMGYSDSQLENLQQTLDLSANQQDIERREYSLPGFQKESENWEKLKGTTGLADVQGKMAFDQFKNAEKQLALANEKQDNLWTNYISNISKQTGKDVSQITDEDINIGFTSAYKVAEDKRRKELIAQGKGDYEDKARYVHPYSSGFGEAFYNLWPGNWKQKTILDYSSPEKVAEINKERNYLTWEQLQDPKVPLPKEAMSDLYGRSEDLDYLFGGASGGRAGYMGGGITNLKIKW